MKSKNKARWLLLPSACLLLLVFLLVGCSSNTHQTSQPNSSPTLNQNQTPSAASSSRLSGTISEAGSTTVQPLAEKLAGAFMAANPDVKVDIKGGGTAVGIKAASDGTVDIGAASRELTQSDPQLLKFLLARDGIAVIVNKDNPVDGLTKAQIRDIFSGQITRWSQVGGPDKDIHVAAREEGSGTRTAFQDLIMGKNAQGNNIGIVKNAVLQSSSGAILQVVQSDPQSISFDSFGYLNSSVKALAVDGIAAAAANAANGSYPVVRPLYFLTKNQPAGVVKAFIGYCTGPDVQKIITGEGYISVK